ncbi:MAG: ABC transporter permease [Sarcina sp.]
MRSILILWINNMKLMAFKNLSRFALFIIGPVILSIFFIKFMPATNTSLNVGIVNSNNSHSSTHIVDVIKENPSINVIEINEDKIKAAFANNEVSAVLEFDKDFEKKIIDGDDVGVKIIGKEEDATHEIVEQTINPYIKNLENLALSAKKNESKYKELLSSYEKENLDIELKSVGVIQKNYDEEKVIIGFLIMLMLYKALFGAERINQDKKEGIFSRVMVSGVSSFKYYLGNILSSITVLIIQIGATLGLLKLILKLDFGMSYMELFFILSLTVILAVSMGTVCVSLTKTSEAASIIGNIVVVVSLMIGGAFIPISFFDGFTDKISKMTPIRWITTMVDNMQNGSTILEQWQSIILVLAISVVLLLIAAFITSKKDKKFIEN